MTYMRSRVYGDSETEGTCPTAKINVLSFSAFTPLDELGVSWPPFLVHHRLKYLATNQRKGKSGIGRAHV